MEVFNENLTVQINIFKKLTYVSLCHKDLKKHLK